jgi:large subunit ribosomal protein L3
MAAVKGILGRKLGMTQVWDSDNRVIPVTVIQAGPCRVVQLKTPERDGYSAVQIAFGAAKEQRLTKPELGHLKKNGAAPSKHLAELRVDDLSPYAVGQVIGADVFVAGERVDVTGISKGKGFTGVMQRHNFKGQGASHGNHKKHRSPGSIGACATPARVFKGMKMAGQHGNERVTTLNLEVVEGDAERGLLLVRGAVPGPNGAIVFVRNAVKGPAVAAPDLGSGNGGARQDTKTDEPAADVPEDEAPAAEVEDAPAAEAEVDEAAAAEDAPVAAEETEAAE